MFKLTIRLVFAKRLAASLIWLQTAGRQTHAPGLLGRPDRTIRSPIWSRWSGVGSKWRPTDLSSLATNLTVVRILDAARESSRTGRTVWLDR